MGASSTVAISPYNQFAYKVLDSEAKRMKEAVSRGEYSCDEAPKFDKLRTTFIRAAEEYTSPIERCKCSSVVIFKYGALSDAEKDEYIKTVLERIIAREKERAKSQNQNAKNADYSQSFGGTAEDTRREKEAAALLRGTDSSEVQEEDAYLCPPDIVDHFERASLRAAGPWKRFMGAGCYMYIHVLSREVVSIRPADYEDEPEEKLVESNEAGVDPSNGLPSCDLTELLSAVERIITEEKKTPLILDPLDLGARAFFAYKGKLQDVSAVTIPFAKSGLKRTDLVEGCRRTLVSALKTGTTFALYLGAASIEHADWKKKLCKKETFPADTFTNAGAKLLQPVSDPRYKLLFREEDLEHGQAVARDGFRVVVISSLDPQEFRSKLEDSIPLGYMSPLYIRRS